MVRCAFAIFTALKYGCFLHWLSQIIDESRYASWQRRTGHPIGINRSREVRQEAGRSVGAREDDERLGGPLWSPAGWGGGRVSPRWKPDEQVRGRP